MDRFFIFVLMFALCGVCLFGLHTKDGLERQIEALQRQLTAQQARTETVNMRLVDYMKRNNDSVEDQNKINKEIIKILNRSTSR